MTERTHQRVANVSASSHPDRKAKDQTPRLRRIEIVGAWWPEDDELIDRLDGAMHDAGLCACDQKHQLYTLAVQPFPEEPPDNRSNAATSETKVQQDSSSANSADAALKAGNG